MRDLETIEAALTIAETGHLVFATLHTNSAIQSINRIIDVFPPHQQAQVRAQLSFVLEGIVSQLLLPRAGAPGRVLALEVLVPNAAIRNLIREDKVHPNLFANAGWAGQPRHADAQSVAVFSVRQATHQLGRGDGRSNDMKSCV
jgi:twitching motility protein PilT